jgi:uncharacterized membrane protein YedE/YeeE
MRVPRRKPKRSARVERARSVAWTGSSLAVGALAGLAVEKLLAMVWRRFTEADQPANTADRRRSWVEALAWGAAFGLGSGLARVVADRSAARLWEAATDETPPTVDD